MEYTLVSASIIVLIIAYVVLAAMTALFWACWVGALGRLFSDWILRITPLVYDPGVGRRFPAG